MFQTAKSVPGGARDKSALPELARMLDVVRPESLRKRTILRLTFFLVMIACTVLAWLLMRQWQDKSVYRALDMVRDNMEHRWAEINLRSLQPVRKLCDEIDSGALTKPEQFSASALAVLKTQSLYETICWVSSDGVRLAGASTSDTPEADSLPFSAESGLWNELRLKAAGGQPVVGPDYEGAFGQSFVLVYFPLGERGDRGAIAAVIRMSRLMDQFLDEELRRLLTVNIIRDEQVIYRTGDYFVERDPKLRLVSSLQMLDQVWLCQLMPTSQFMRQYDSQTDEIVLAVGSVGCLIAAGSLLDAMKRKWQHMILERGHLQIIEIMSELSRSISASRGEWKRALLSLLESAHPVIDSDVIGIYQLSSDRRRLELISGYGQVLLNKTVELTDTAMDSLRDVLEGRLIPISEGDRDAMGSLRLFDATMLHSGMLAPLVSDRVIGVMLFASRRDEVWSDARRSLAKLWASQTAALLSDEAIHQQMRDALSVQEKLAQRREMMLTLLGELYQAGSAEGTLAHMAQFAPKSLGIEACVVALRTKTENELEIVAATGELGVRLFGRRMPLTGEQIVRLSRPEGYCVIAPKDVRGYGLSQLSEPWLAGLAYVPMSQTDGRAIGCLLLLSASKGAFTDDQLELARVLTQRASAAIENAKLNEQIRRNAETRAMLLRELNHRVKNNLAGIVGLLAMSSNMEMPNNVRQWLDRVTERIGNIARAHELFSGGITAVSIAQLVEQVIPSLAVVKPPGVVIIKNLGEREIWLKTTQAVSLAMVLHELCYNAIVHGLGACGALTINARQTETNTVVIDIIDEGAEAQQLDNEGGVATMAPPKTTTGLGLNLVKGLVGRELRGRFLMRRRSKGGTIVTVEFPLERERDEGESRR